MGDHMDCDDSRNNEDTDLAESIINYQLSASGRSEMRISNEELATALVEGIAELTKLRAEVAAMQVECVKQEESFFQENDPKLLEEAREVLEWDTTEIMEMLDEMENTS